MSDLTAAGFGTANVDGDFTVFGTHNSRDSFKHNTQNFYIFYNRDVMANYTYVLHTSVGDLMDRASALYYLDPNAQASPINVTWTVGSGAASAGTISAAGGGGGPADVDTVCGVAAASVATVDGVAYADIASINGVE